MKTCTRYLSLSLLAFLFCISSTCAESSQNNRGLVFESNLLDYVFSQEREFFTESEIEQAKRNLNKLHGKLLSNGIETATPGGRLVVLMKTIFSKTDIAVHKHLAMLSGPLTEYAEKSTLSPVGENLDPRDLLLTSFLLSKEGTCYSLTLTCHAFALLFDIPLHCMYAPYHMLLRYDDGRQRFNLETTQRGFPVTNRQFMKFYRLGEEAVRKGLYLRKLTASEVKIMVSLQCAGVLLRMKKKNRAREILERMLKKDPRFIPSNIAALQTFLNKRNFEKAEKYAKALLNLHPKRILALQAMVRIRCRQEKYREVVHLTNRILGIHGNNYMALIYAGRAHMELRNPKEALTYLRRALQLDSNDVRLITYLSACLYHLRDGTADIYLKRAIEMNTWSTAPYLSLAYSHMQAMRLRSSIDVLRAALKRFPRNSRFRDLLSYLLVLTEQHDEVIDVLFDLKTDEDIAQYTLQLLYFFVAHKDWRASNCIVTISRKSKPAKHNFYYYYALYLLLIGKRKDAEFVLRKRIESKAQDVDAQLIGIAGMIDCLENRGSNNIDFAYHLAKSMKTTKDIDIYMHIRDAILVRAYHYAAELCELLLQWTNKQWLLAVLGIINDKMGNTLQAKYYYRKYLAYCSSTSGQDSFKYHESKKRLAEMAADSHMRIGEHID
jgi:tetratricopeptide (TPR) repeat protein